MFFLLYLSLLHIKNCVSLTDNYYDEENMEIEKPETIHYPNQANSNINCTRDTDIIDALTVKAGYNKLRIPGDAGMSVAVEIWIQAINSVDELTNDFEMDIYITETWIDPALNFADMNPCKQNLSLNEQVLSKLWTPNSCFINSKIASIHEAPFKSVFLMLFPNGTVMVNYRVRVKGPCQLDLSNFPLDLQTCSLIYESFNYNNQEVSMYWSTNPTYNNYPATNLTPIVLPDFDMINITATKKILPYPAGMWDELHLYVVIERRFIWYFMQGYLPTVLTILISWVSFFLGSKAIPARTMLGVNSLLAIVFQFGNIMRNLPRVSYVKAIDVWMLASMAFIFCTLLELAIIGYMVRDEGKPKKKPSRPTTPSADHNPQSPGGFEKRFMYPASYKPVMKYNLHNLTQFLTPERIDRFSSIMFPLTFLVFNIVYWSYYLHRKQEITEYMAKAKFAE